MVMKIVSYILNRLPLIKYIDGKKTTIAGVLVALSAIIVAVAPFIPAPYDVYALAISTLVEQLAGTLGTLGVAGLLAKKWSVPKFPEKPETPELIK